MIYTIISLLAAGIILFIDRRKLKEYKQKRETRVYFAIFVVGVSLLVIKGTGGEMPTPLNWINYVLKPLTGFMR